MSKRNKSANPQKDVLVLRRTDPTGDEPLWLKVRDFYEVHPCGGDASVEDSRWHRLPWLENEFRPAAYAGKRVLDLGCGIGIDMERFLEVEAVVVGVDFASKPLAYARDRLANADERGKWHLVRADARFLPFKGEVFDHFYSNGVLHHIAEYRKVLQEAHRCLKGGHEGTVLVYHWRSLMTWLTVLLRLASRKQGGDGGRFLSVRSVEESTAMRAGYEEVVRHPLIQYFSRRALERSIHEAGFDITRVRAYDWAFPLRHRMEKKAGLLDRWFGRFLVSRIVKVEPVAASS